MISRTSSTPPHAKKMPVTQTTHHDTRIDAYHWLRNKADPATMEYLHAENVYTNAMMRHTKPLQKRLFAEMKGRMQETDRTVPAKWGNYFYYTRTVKGKQFPIECRKKGSLKAKEEILLDQNRHAKGKKFFAIGSFEVSPDQSRIAYSVDCLGNEIYHVHVKDLHTGKVVDEEVKNAYDSLAWATDNQTFLYTVLDSAHRPYRVYRHIVGTKIDQDVLVFEERDERFSVRVHTSKSLAYIFISSESNLTSEVHVLDARCPTDKPWCFEKRKQGVEYSLTHQEDRFYLLTNEKAENFRLFAVPVVTPQRSNWKEVVKAEKDTTLDSLEVFERYVVLFERHRGVRGISILDREGKRHKISFPEEVRDVNRQSSFAYHSSCMRFRYSSFVTPHSVYEYDMDTHTMTLLKQNKVRRHDPKRYVSERVWAKTKDGTRIPLSLVYRKGMQQTGKNPCLLYGYGAYGICIDPSFSVHRLSLLDRGVVFAIAHIRGGSDLGIAWHKKGKFQHKKNTFTDFIACAEYLIKKQYTSSAHLSIKGGSAGGLLMGAVTNMRPDLFQAVVAEVPFVDVLNTMLDPSLPLTVREYEEWGNPQQEKFYRAIKAYSPYDQVSAKAYPHMLVTAGLHDPRVSYWEPAKWVAKLRDLKTDDHLLFLKTEMSAGHAGPSGRYAYLQDMAFQYAFLLDCWGIKK